MKVNAGQKLKREEITAEVLKEIGKHRCRVLYDSGGYWNPPGDSVAIIYDLDKAWCPTVEAALKHDTAGIFEIIAPPTNEIRVRGADAIRDKHLYAGMPMYLIDSDGVRYWRNEPSIRTWSGYANTREEAGPPSEIMVGYNSPLASWGVTCLFIKPGLAEEPKDDKPIRMSSVEQVLSAGLIQMLTLQPNNPTFRTMAMTQLSCELPAWCDTWEKIKDWIEFTFAPRSVSQAAAAPAPPPANSSMTFNIDVSETQVGTCRYAVGAYGSGRRQIQNGRIVEMARECEDMRALTDMIREELVEEHHLDEIETEWGEDVPDYDRHERTETRDFDWRFDERAAQDRIAEFLRNNHPDLAQRLGLVAEQEMPQELRRDTGVPEENIF